MRAVVDKGFLAPGVVNELDDLEYSKIIEVYISYIISIYDIEKENIEEF